MHPIYALRQLRGQTHLEIKRQTLAGLLVAFRQRMTGQPVVEHLGLYHNPTLHAAAAVITWSTVLLAVYDILGPLLTQVFTGTETRPLPIMLMELLMGLGLSVAGVFFLQSAAHEIGVRTLTDQPPRLDDVLEQRQAAYNARRDAIRADVRERYAAAKRAEQERKQPANPTVPALLVPVELSHNHNGHSDMG